MAYLPIGISTLLFFLLPGWLGLSLARAQAECRPPPPEVARLVEIRPGFHRVAGPLADLARQYPQVQVELVTQVELPQELGPMRLASRQTIALACGSASSVERFARGMFLAGLPRNQLFADVFVGHA